MDAVEKARLGANCPAGDWVPFVPDVFRICRGSTPASSTGRSCPAVSVPADRPRMGSAAVLTMAVVVVAEPAVIACLAFVGQNLWFRLYHHHRKTETHRTTWLRPAKWEVAAGTVTSRMLIKVFEKLMAESKHDACVSPTSIKFCLLAARMQEIPLLRTIDEVPAIDLICS